MLWKCLVTFEISELLIAQSVLYPTGGDIALFGRWLRANRGQFLFGPRRLSILVQPSERQPAPPPGDLMLPTSHVAGTVNLGLAQRLARGELLGAWHFAFGLVMEGNPHAGIGLGKAL